MYILFLVLVYIYLYIFECHLEYILKNKIFISIRISDLGHLKMDQFRNCKNNLFLFNTNCIYNDMM